MEVMGKFMALILMTVSWVYIYHQTHQVSYTLTIYSFLYYQLYLNKAVLKKDKSRGIFFCKIAWVNMNIYEAVNRKTEVV